MTRKILHWVVWDDLDNEYGPFLEWWEVELFVDNASSRREYTVVTCYEDSIND